MEAAQETAPPVVASMVVHEPGEWFAEVLDGLARQDYVNLRLLFLLSGDTAAAAEQIRQRLPDAFVGILDGDPGYAQAANEVARLVEGTNGFFCLLHDDVALDPGAIRLLVEELYRSNAGIVGPKLVEWDDNRRLQHVGLGVDRFGEVDPFVEPGETDQEQLDAVRDVFAVPSACMLIRADLFHTLGGFDDALRFYGEDVDLCWRAHLTGARVIVVPSARARHREQLIVRRPDVRHEAMKARHRMRAVATLTAARQLPLTILQLVVATLAELVIGVVTGRPRRAFASFAAMVGMIPRLGGIVARRRDVAPLRQVPANEVSGLQVRGSARLASYLRSRDRRPVEPESSTQRRWRQTAGSAPAIAWFVVIAALLIGSRDLITHGVPRFGELLRYPQSPRGLLDQFGSGWSPHGLGATSPSPTGLALVGVGSTITLFHMGLWHTVALLGLLVVGALGIWRLGSLFPTPRARIAALVVYLALPLPSELLSAGRWGALASYAATPWVVHALRRVAGIDTIGTATNDAVEQYVEVPLRSRVRMLAQLALLVAVTMAFVPAYALVVLGVGAILALTTLIVGGSWRASGVLFLAAVVVVVAGWLANLPWSASLLGKGSWTAVVGVPLAGPPSLGLARLARFGLGRGSIGPFALLLYVPVVAAPLVARGWRFTWAVRATGLIAGFGAVLVLADRGSLFARMPEPGVLLAPVGVGVALSAACIAAAFQDDVLGGSFGWRQPLGLLSAAALVIGVIPGVAAIGSGRWDMPQLTLPAMLDQLPPTAPGGDYRILWLGDPRLIPVAPWAYSPGIGYAVTDGASLSLGDAWPGIPSATEQGLTDAIDAMRAETTLRAGRMLAPYGIRYVIIPIADGAISTLDKPIPVPAGLTDALNDQLDLTTPLTAPLNFVVYENNAWTPTRSELTGDGVSASKEAVGPGLTGVDLRGSRPFGSDARPTGPFVAAVQPGTVHFAVPFDTRWSLRVNGTEIQARRAFGTTMAFDVPAAGTATLTYATSTSRRLLVALQIAIWVVLGLLASRLDPSTWRRWRRGRNVDTVGGPVVSFDDDVAVMWADDDPDDISPNPALQVSGDDAYVGPRDTGERP